MTSVPSEATSLLRASQKLNLNSHSDDELSSSTIDLSVQDKEFGLGTPVPAKKKSQKDKFASVKNRTKSPLEQDISPTIELKDDLLTSFQTRALTESTGSLYEDV